MALPAALRRGAERYDLLLAVVVTVLVLSPFEGRVVRAVEAVLLLSCFLFALWTTAAFHSVLAAAVVFGGIGVASAVVALTGTSRPPRAIYAGISVAMCVTTIVMVVMRMLPRRRVSARLLAAVVVIYLLTGLLFCYIYLLIASVSSAGFFAQTGHHDVVDYVYFSFITLTTVGYGDLTAGNDAGRMLTAIEALFGQIYLVTVVAVVVRGRAEQRAAREL